MTAIYGYVSPNNKIAAMLADDTEYSSKRKVNKISIISDRYAVGIYGQDTVESAIGAITAFQGTNREIHIPNVGSLASLICKYTNQVVSLLRPHYLEAVKNGTIPKETWDILLNNTANLVVMDIQCLALYQVEIGQCFAEELSLKPKINKLAEDTLHFFALARSANKSTERALSINEMQKPIETLSDQLSMDKTKTSSIGNVGSYVVHEQGRLTVGTAFSGPEELLENSLGQDVLLGFQIIVSS